MSLAPGMYYGFYIYCNNETYINKLKLNLKSAFLGDI